MKKFWVLPLYKKSSGGVAIEYIIITTFATAISIAAIGFIAKAFESKLQTMSQKLNIQMSDDDMNLDNIFNSKE